MFELPLVVVERDIVVGFGPGEGTLDRGIGNFEESGGGLLLAALADFTDEALDADVLQRNLLEEAVLDSVAERWPSNTLPIGDVGVDTLLNA